MTDMEVEEPPSLVDDTAAPLDESRDEGKDAASLVRMGLFAAIEGGFDEDTWAGDDDEANSYRPLMRLFSPSKSTRSIKPGATARELKVLIMDTVGGFHKGHARRFFAGIKPMVQRVIEEEEYVPESAYQDDDTAMGSQAHDNASIPPEDITPDESSTQALRFLHLATQFLQAYLDGVVDKRSTSSRKSHVGQAVPIISEAFEVAELLHEILLSLHSCGPDALPVQSALLGLFETWWLANATQRENLILQVLPLLVVRTLGVDGKDAKKSDITRLQKLYDAFQVIDFSDESSDSLRSLLLKVASSPLCLKLKEGKKFIAGLFLLDPSLVSDLHQAIRIQIPQAKKPILKAYGEIYRKAWKDSHNNTNCPEEIQPAIEEDVLQDLMYSVLHIAKPQMSKHLMLVLEPFHEGKKASDIEGLLCRMYGPILWRALTVANPQVRINAAYILGEVFPLQEPSHAQADAAFKRAATALKALLKDKNPKVRVAASETTAKVLATYWDILSTDDIRVLLNLIVTKHASDASSYQVRVGALKAVTVLLDAPQCHAVLRALLPSLGNLVHDQHKNVRLAAVDMLLRVKAVKGIKYYHVVPVDHLKARLADEGRRSSLNSTAYNPLLYLSPVASGLTRLMLNSFVPHGPDVSAVDQIKRTLSFLATDPDAAAVFYANLADHLPPMAIAKLASMLLRCLTAAIDTDKKTKKAGASAPRKKDDESANDSFSDSEDDDNDESQEGDGEVVLTASNSSFMAALSEVIASLWESIAEELEYEDEEACQKFLVKSFSGATLTDILGYFGQEANATNDPEKTEDYGRIHAAILRCAAFLEPTHVEGLFEHITKTLRSLSSNKRTPKKNVSTESVSDLIALLCLWNMEDDVASSLCASISSAFDDGDDFSLLSPVSDDSGRKRKSSRGARRKSSTKNSMVPTLPAAVAMDVLNGILCGSNPGNLTAREKLMESMKAREILEETFEQATQYTGRFFRAATSQAQTVNDTHCQLILKVIDAFGRFALHKAACVSIEQGTMIELNLEAKHLLEWTTQQVLPAVMTEGKGIPLQELDLSRISFANDSMVSMELDQTLDTDPETTPLAPPRKKGNRNSTPERLDGTCVPRTKRKDSRVIPGDSTAMLVRSLSSCVLQTSCVNFAEWLLVGAGSGATDILEEAAAWCCILDGRSEREEADDKENSVDDKLTACQIYLLPAFARLSIAFAKSASNFRLVKQVLRQIPRFCDEDGDLVTETIETLVQDTVSALLRVAPKEQSVSALLEVVYDLLPAVITEIGQSSVSGESKDGVESPSCAYDVVCCGDKFSPSATVIASAVNAIVAQKQSSLILADTLATNLCAFASADVDEGGVNESTPDNEASVLFEARCLWFIWDSGACRKAPAFKGILQKLAGMDQTNEDFFGDGKVAGALVQEIIESDEPPSTTNTEPEVEQHNN